MRTTAEQRYFYRKQFEQTAMQRSLTNQEEWQFSLLREYAALESALAEKTKRLEEAEEAMMCLDSPSIDAYLKKYGLLAEEK